MSDAMLNSEDIKVNKASSAGGRAYIVCGGDGQFERKLILLFTALEMGLVGFMA